MDRHGVAHTGTAEEPATTVVERLYFLGFEWAEAVEDGEVVGAVLRNPSTRQRTWWAES
jgi:hypothetical protein